jgi:peptidoglycan/xylan/chitin deacetylase (PgdA/CDA1 family)
MAIELKHRYVEHAGRLGRLAVLTLAMGVFLGCAPRWAVRLYSDEYGEPLFYIETDRLVVALTIDDGPDPMTTPAILDVLARYRARATFFLISGNIPGNGALVRRLLAEGHEIGNHMTRDEPSIDLPPDRFNQLTKAHQALSAYGPVRWFRPGGGRSTAAMRSAARQLGYRTALGEVYPFDPHIPSVTWIRLHIAAVVRPGSIIVLHDRDARGWRTAEALGHLLPALAARGYRVVTLSALVAQGTPLENDLGISADDGPQPGGAGDLSPGYQTAASAMSDSPFEVANPAPVLAPCYQRDDAVRPGSRFVASRCPPLARPSPLRVSVTKCTRHHPAVCASVKRRGPP